MKRCPKCNRTYPSETQKFCTRDGGLLVLVTDAPAETGSTSAPSAGQVDTGPLQPFDPYKTVIEQPQPSPSQSPLSATISLPANPPAPTGPIQTSTPLPSPQPAVTPPKQSSRAGLIVGTLAVLLVLGVVVIGAAYVVFIRPRLANRTATSNSKNTSRQRVAQPSPATTPSTTPEANTPDEPAFVPPANATEFVNTNDKLEGNLAQHYFEFSFYYPNDWKKDPGSGVSGAKNFVQVERRIPPDFTQENFAVGYYTSTGSDATDRDLYPGFVKDFNSRYQKQFQEYRKVSEGETRAGIYRGYEFRFEAFSRNTEKGDLKIWGRTIFLPPPDGGKNGAVLLILATSLAPELKSINDVGVKGELPIILESFRFGKQ